jgi:isopenicillin N synthase-like dioxygenase
VNPPRELWGTSRYSIPFFMHPVSDMNLNCLPECIDDKNPKLLIIYPFNPKLLILMNSNGYDE